MIHSVLFVPMLLLCTLFVYFQSIFFDFITWDDLSGIIQNHELHKGNWLRFWQAPFNGMWIPIPYTLWTALQALAPKDQPALPFHLLNVWLHFMNGLLVFKWLETYQAPETPKKALRSCLGSLLFLLHPLQVQTVAWVSGGRDLLATFFSLLSLLSFTRSRYVFFFIAFLCALGSKPSSVVLPLLVICMQQAPVSKSSARFLLFLCLPCSILVSFLTSQLQPLQPHLTPWFQRPFLIIQSLWYYGTQFILPTALTFDPALKVQDALQDSFLPLKIFLSLFVVLSLLRAKQTRKSSLAILLALMPVLGIFSFDFQRISLVSNHYAYFAFIPFSYLCLSILMRPYLLAGFAIWIISLGVQSFEEVAYWKDSRTLFARAVRVQHKSYSAHLHLAVQLHSDQDLVRALHHYKEAQSIERTEAVARNLGLLYAKTGELEKAEQAFLESVRLAPFFPENWLHLAKVVAARGRKQEAEHYKQLASGLTAGGGGSHLRFDALAGHVGKTDR